MKVCNVKACLFIVLIKSYGFLLININYPDRKHFNFY